MVNYLASIIWFSWFVAVIAFDVALNKFMSAFVLFMLSFSTIVIESLKKQNYKKSVRDING